jgi:hypothetical protein
MASFDYNSIADMLHSVRQKLDSYQPSVGTALGLASGPTGWLTAIPGPQSLALNNFKSMKGPMDRTEAPAAPAAAPTASPGMQQQSAVPYPNMGGLPAPMSPQAPVPMPQPRPAMAPQPQAPVPMPQPRPAMAPQAPQAAPQWPASSNQHQGLIARAAHTLQSLGQPQQGNPQHQGLIGRIGSDIQSLPGFFQHNAQAMRDPSTGGFIDPAGAAQAQSQVRGPDLINKMMGYLHGQSYGDIGNNNDPSTLGSG